MSGLQPKPSVRQEHVALRDGRVLTMTVDLDTRHVSVLLTGKEAPRDLLYMTIPPGR